MDEDEDEKEEKEDEIRKEEGEKEYEQSRAGMVVKIGVEIARPRVLTAAEDSASKRCRADNGRWPRGKKEAQDRTRKKRILISASTGGRERRGAAWGSLPVRILLGEILYTTKNDIGFKKYIYYSYDTDTD